MKKEGLALSKAPYLLRAQEVLQELQVSPEQGLSKKEAARRQAWGKNSIPANKRFRVLKLFLERFKDVLVIILLIAAAASFWLGHPRDTIIIFIAIAVDVLLSFAQVWRTEKTLQSMRKRIEDKITVIRHGVSQIIPSSHLTVGDIVELKAGESVPADGRLFEVHGLTAQEAVLTGESTDVQKNTKRMQTKTSPPSQLNMAFAGTSIVNGSGKMVVTSVGTQTEFGRIAQMIREQSSPSSPLKRKLQKSGIQIGWIIVAAVLLLTIIGLFQGQDLAETARTAITLIVSAIPEDLTMILTIALTVGVARILRSGGVVRKLSSGESLGAATVICTDKTGTLTEGNMKAVGLSFLQGDTLLPFGKPSTLYEELALTALAVVNDAHRTEEGSDTRYVGSATERAALAFAEAGEIDQRQLKSIWRSLDEISFSSEWKYRASLVAHPIQNTHALFVLGAPDVLLERSSQALAKNDEPAALDSEWRQKLSGRIDALANQGKRLLAVAVRRSVELSEITHDDVHDLLFLGVLIIEDPIRDDIPHIIRQTQQAGVAVKLVTGDHAGTAKAVARAIGLAANDDVAINGERLREMSDEELTEVLEHATVFARVEPLDKQRLVRLLQKQGHVVAMTGDGVNDAVALKSADIGVAMGSGTDIAKDASDLVLLNNSFATIVAAIREGRVLRDNIRKVMAFLLSTNAAEVAIFFASIFLGLPLPLLPAQILWINLVTDGTSDIALSLEPAEDDVMARPPEDPHVSLLENFLVWRILFSGLIMTIGTMVLFGYLLKVEQAALPYARTMAFTFLSLASLLSVWSFRSLKNLLWKHSVLDNPWVLVSSGFSLGLHMLALYVPGMQRFFDTVPLGAYDWLILIALSIVTVAGIDLGKLLFIRAQQQKNMKGLQVQAAVRP